MKKEKTKIKIGQAAVRTQKDAMKEMSQDLASDSTSEVLEITHVTKPKGEPPLSIDPRMSLTGMVCRIVVILCIFFLLCLAVQYFI